MEIYLLNPSVPREKDVKLSIDHGKSPLNEVAPSSSDNGGGCSPALPCSDVRKGLDRGVAKEDGWILMEEVELLLLLIDALP